MRALGRLLRERTSFLWVIGLSLVLGEQLLGRAAVGRQFEQTAVADLFYVHTHFSVRTSLVAFSLGMAMIYLALEQLRRGRHRRALGAIHVGGTVLGMCMINAPPLLVHLGPSRGDVTSQFQWLNTIATTGYVVMVAAQAVFILVLLDALRPRLQVG